MRGEKGIRRSSTAWLFIAACGAAAFRMAAVPVSDPDLFWHLAAGRLVWAQGRIPEADPFSWTVKGAEWIAHEWLWEAIAYPLFRHIGWLLVPVCAGVGVVMTFDLLLRAARRSRIGDTAVEVCLVPALIGLMPFVSSARPQIASCVLFAAFIVILQGGPGRVLWLLPALEVVWANTHASFILGPCLVAFCGLAEAARERRLPRARFWSVLAATALAGALNPRGFRLYAYTLSIAGSGPAREFISEWFSPDFGSFVGVASVGAWLLLDLLALAYRRDKDIKDTGLVVIFAALALTSIRHAPYLIIASVPVVARWLGAVLPQTGEMGAGTARLLNVGCVVLIALLIGTTLARPVGVDPGVVPVGAADYILANGMEGQLLNEYAYGGYLIWRGVPVFVDGRADVYLPSGLFEKEVRTETLQSDPEVLMRAYGVRRVLVSESSALARYLAGRPGWKTVYRDDTAIVFAREGE